MTRLATLRRRTKRSDHQHTRLIGYLTATGAVVTALATLIAAVAAFMALFVASHLGREVKPPAPVRCYAARPSSSPARELKCRTSAISP